MCGIFGFIASDGSLAQRPLVEETMRLLAHYSEERGKEASGMAVQAGGAISYYKTSLAISRMLGTKAFQDFFTRFMDGAYAGAAGAPREPFAFLGHSRLVTNGIETVARNNQPVATAHSVGVHNGIIVNDLALWAENPDLVRAAEIDTAVFYSLLDKYRAQGRGEAAALAQVYQAIVGSASVAYLNDQGQTLGLATNTGSLHYALSPKGGFLFFASERHTLDRIIRHHKLPWPADDIICRQLEPGTGVLVDLARLGIAEIDLTAQAEPDRSAPPAEGSRALPIQDRSATPADLRRCTRCVLPETFPFIEFDSDGVCNVCRRYQPSPLSGKEALLKEVETYRSHDGSPDCIVAFSGGRDSSYVLHYAKKVLGLNPIAFTFDWGMVTDVARRNQARIVGELGVEHIIRSPDIRVKRRNIRKNLQAWMHRPNLGMIPLFSAGDKGFYRYGRELRKETGVRLTLFGAADIERTEFKTGFCGVRENEHGMRMQAYSWQNKAQFIGYFARQYGLNWRYINTSLWDTLLSYFSTYIAKDDFLYLFQYIDWDEELIIDTLQREYGWESAPDAETTWRIDDAFTPFHNYIYYTVAGFNEHDTFRSNQIRRGIITREQAMELLETDHAPRLEAMRDYAAYIGMNLEELMLCVEAIPKLYER